MKTLHRRAFGGFLRTLAILLAAVFVPVWSFGYWQGWACLAAFFVPAAIISVYVAKTDPALLERRMKAGAKAEKESGQKVVQGIAAIVFFADFLLPAFDHRFGWSHVPAWACVAGDLMIFLGFAIVFAVLRPIRTPPHHRSRRGSEGYLHWTLRRCSPSHVHRRFDYAVWDTFGTRLMVGNAREYPNDCGGHLEAAR